MAPIPQRKQHRLQPTATLGQRVLHARGDLREHLPRDHPVRLQMTQPIGQRFRTPPGNADRSCPNRRDTFGAGDVDAVDTYFSVGRSFATNRSPSATRIPRAFPGLEL